MKNSVWGSPSKQMGLTGILVTILLVVFIFFAALAIDVNHALLNKTRLQNGVDAAALAAAVKLDSGESDETARTVALQTLSSMYSAAGNTELGLLSSKATEYVNISFSNDPQDFLSGSYDSSLDSFVRVAVQDVPLNAYFVHFFGVAKTSSASAVAGPSSSLNCTCNIVPLAVCINIDEDDPDLYNAENNWGYESGDIHQLKVGDSDESDLTAGNYQLLDFGNDIHIRDALAGGYEGCVCINDEDPPPITESKPGNTIGPTAQGLNTRFGDYKSGLSSDVYPSDGYTVEAGIVVTNTEDGSQSFSFSSSNSVTFDTYNANAMSNGRRVLNIPMIDCSEAKNGKTQLPIVGIRCFLMLQKASSDNSTKGAIYGEFGGDNCAVDNGTQGINPNAKGPYKIILYKDHLSGES